MSAFFACKEISSSSLFDDLLIFHYINGGQVGVCRAWGHLDEVKNDTC